MVGLCALTTAAFWAVSVGLYLNHPRTERLYLVDGVPPALDDLVLELLRKSRRDRLGYAEIVAARLADLGIAGPPANGEPPEPYLYRAELAGRGEILGRLEALPSSARRAVERAVKG